MPIPDTPAIPANAPAQRPVAASATNPADTSSASDPAQPIPGFTATPQAFTYDEFIAAVIDGNLAYAAQRYNVDIARAQLAAATLVPNPSLQLYGNRDLTYHDAHGVGTDGERVLLRQVESRSGGLTQTLELGGKRTWRIRVADQTLQATAANLEDFLRNLKADASEAFVLALATKATV
ncbi:MAG TPA: TolC family protein, partial [Pseudomonadales bacterium]|nr:TolC family protein [Pseudomonadales bacterium]